MAKKTTVNSPFIPASVPADNIPDELFAESKAAISGEAVEDSLSFTKKYPLWYESEEDDDTTPSGVYLYSGKTFLVNLPPEVTPDVISTYFGGGKFSLRWLNSSKRFFKVHNIEVGGKPLSLEQQKLNVERYKKDYGTAMSNENESNLLAAQEALLTRTRLEQKGLVDERKLELDAEIKRIKLDSEIRISEMQERSRIALDEAERKHKMEIDRLKLDNEARLERDRENNALQRELMLNMVSRSDKVMEMFIPLILNKKEDRKDPLEGLNTVLTIAKRLNLGGNNNSVNWLDALKELAPVALTGLQTMALQQRRKTIVKQPPQKALPKQPTTAKQSTELKQPITDKQAVTDSNNKTVSEKVNNVVSIKSKQEEKQNTHEVTSIELKQEIAEEVGKLLSDAMIKFQNQASPQEAADWLIDLATENKISQNVVDFIADIGENGSQGWNFIASQTSQAFAAWLQQVVALIPFQDDESTQVDEQDIGSEPIDANGGKDATLPDNQT